MNRNPSIAINNTQFLMKRQRILEELILRMNSVQSFAILTIDEDGTDQIEVLGDLCALQELAALTTQQLSAEITPIKATH